MSHIELSLKSWREGNTRQLPDCARHTPPRILLLFALKRSSPDPVRSVPSAHSDIYSSDSFPACLCHLALLRHLLPHLYFIDFLVIFSQI